MPLRKLEPSFHERVWGTRNLNPWFPAAPRDTALPIGEVWFETPEISLLVKFLFTSENLSVQVHPDDHYAQLHHNSPGKTEMWHVLAAQEGAKIAAGFREPVTKEQVREAALDGTIVDLLQWFDAKVGDTFYIPAGTVHAIGAGLTICEIQQPSDITYRLYDYGRGRELHLDRALAVSRLEPHAPRTDTKVLSPHFVTELLSVNTATKPLASPGRELLIAIAGGGKIGGQPVHRGDVFLTVSPYTIENIDTLILMRTHLPAHRD